MTRFLFAEACGYDYTKKINRNKKIARPQCVKNCTYQIIIIIRLIAYNLCKIRVFTVEKLRGLIVNLRRKQKQKETQCL